VRSRPQNLALRPRTNITEINYSWWWWLLTHTATDISGYTWGKSGNQTAQTNWITISASRNVLHVLLQTEKRNLIDNKLTPFGTAIDSSILQCCVPVKFEVARQEN